MFVDECHVISVNQGLFSTTMEAEKRDPWNEVALCIVINSYSSVVYHGWEGKKGALNLEPRSVMRPPPQPVSLLW